MAHRKGGRRMSLKKAILFLSVFAGMTREVKGVAGTAVALPRNSLGAGNMGRRTDAMPPAVYVPQNAQPGGWAKWWRTGVKTSNTASKVANAALNVVGAGAEATVSIAQGTANLASAAQKAAETVRNKAPEVATVSIDAAVALAVALQRFATYGTGIFLFMCFVTFVAEDTLLLCENIVLLNRLTIHGRERAEMIKNRAELWKLQIKSLSNKSINSDRVGRLLAEAQQLIKDHDELRRLFRQGRETKASKLASAVRTTAGVVTGGLIPLPLRKIHRRLRTTSGPSSRPSPNRANTGTSPRPSPNRANTGTSPRRNPLRATRSV